MSLTWCNKGFPLLVSTFPVAEAAPNERGWVAGPIVPLGYYWWIYFCSIWNSDNNGQSLCLLAQDTSQPNSPTPDAWPNWTTAAATGDIAPGAFAISPMQGMDDALDTELITQESAMIAPIRHTFPIMLPQLWRLLAVETNGVFSGNQRNIGMKLAYIQLAFGEAPPIYK